MIEDVHPKKRIEEIKDSGNRGKRPDFNFAFTIFNWDKKRHAMARQRTTKTFWIQRIIFN